MQCSPARGGAFLLCLCPCCRLARQGRRGRRPGKHGLFGLFAPRLRGSLAASLWPGCPEAAQHYPGAGWRGLAPSCTSLGRGEIEWARAGMAGRSGAGERRALGRGGARGPVNDRQIAAPRPARLPGPGWPPHAPPCLLCSGQGPPQGPPARPSLRVARVAATRGVTGMAVVAEQDDDTVRIAFAVQREA